ncbi:hypothetical protein HUO13_03550 [Saccharopolyspora erythraea]|uniref:hypothetical protein n=1 Tax=Saccharopolyspora erythraea TaxID=1836 RepID=UPI001BAB3D67|nr:hypothetical protein [Saccharopolyspora erythraea]QUH00008.1 hypothetical protein HUO13_03550 [Saccharopolyspora erythraea]
MTEQVPASVRYKELSAAATTAAQRMRRHEQDKAAELEESVTRGNSRKEEADQQREQVEKDVRTRWTLALEALWDERWLKVSSLPDPDLSAPPATPEESRRAVQDAFLELHDALDKPRWSAGSLLRRKSG